MSQEIEKLVLTADPNIYSKNKDGGEYKTKTGKKFFRVVMNVEKYGDVSGLVFDTAPTWKKGDAVEASVKEEEYNGKRQLKFELPKSGGGMKEALEQALQDINQLKVGQNILAEQLKDLGDIVMKLKGEDEINPDVIGF